MTVREQILGSEQLYFYFIVDESVYNGRNQKYPYAFIHHRPSDLILFESSAILKFVLTAAKAPKIIASKSPAIQSSITSNPRDHWRKSCEEALKLVNELNKNFSTDGYLCENCRLSTVKRTQIENSLLSGEINNWLRHLNRKFFLKRKSIRFDQIFNFLSGCFDSRCPVTDEKSFSRVSRTMRKVLPCDDGSTETF